MKKWSSFERVASSDQRIQLIVFDINDHFLNNDKAKELPFKAMLTTDKKKDAVRYLRAFEALGDSNVGVVISAPDVRKGYNQLDEVSEDIVVNFWKERKFYSLG